MQDFKKKYEEITKRVKELHESGNALTRLQMEVICPELAESEDERIRKEIIQQINQYVSDSDKRKKSWIAWLEKQKVNTEGDFSRGYDSGYEAGKKDGYWEGYKRAMESNNNSVTFHQDLPSKMPDVPTYATTSDSSNVKDLKVEQKEQKPADYEHEMWKNCKANFEGGKNEVISNPEKYGLQKPAEWSEKDKEMLEKCVSHMINIIPVPGKHGLEDMSFEKHIDEELVIWLSSLPERFNLQSKQEWSEEDEKILDIVLTMVDCSTVVPHSGGQLYPSESYKKYISNWLKSLRPQPHWKPSKEQMNALDNARFCKAYDYDALNELYEQLLYKQLKQL